MTMLTVESFSAILLIIGVSSVVRCQVPTVCKDQYFADQSDCTKFYTCVHGQPISQSCPSPLHWNDQYKTCDWEYSAKCVANNNAHSQPSQQSHQQINQWAQPQQQVHQAPTAPQQPHQQVNGWTQPINQWAHQQPQQQQWNQWAHQQPQQQQPIHQMNNWAQGHQSSGNNPSAYPQVNNQYANDDYPEYEDEEPPQVNQQPAHGLPQQPSMPVVPNQTSTKCGPEKKSVCYCKLVNPKMNNAITQNFAFWNISFETQKNSYKLGLVSPGIWKIHAGRYRPRTVHACDLCIRCD